MGRTIFEISLVVRLEVVLESSWVLTGGYFVVFPALDDMLPCYVGPHAIERRILGLFAAKEIPTMLEAHYIPWLRGIPFEKLAGSWSSDK